MKVRTVTRTTHLAQLDELDAEVELEFEPVEGADVLTHLSDDGKMLVVGYLVQDESPSDPLKDSEANGNIYTWNEGVITDDKGEMLRIFGLEDRGVPDLDRGFDLIPYAKPISLCELAAEILYVDILRNPERLADWFKHESWPQLGLKSRYFRWAINNQEKLFKELLDNYNGFFEEDVNALAVALYTTHWKQIVGPYVVPMNYQSQSYTIISPTSFDGDPDDIPNCVWVADALAKENITPRPKGISIEHFSSDTSPNTYAVLEKGTDILFKGAYPECSKWIKDNLPPTTPDDLRDAAERYSKAVAEEYANWCSGYVYGCVVQTFDLVDDEWVKRDDYDSCWGHIGDEYAEEALKDEYFAYAVKNLKPLVDPNQLPLEI